MEDSKKPWLSKTLILNFVVAILAVFYPPAKEFIESKPDIAVSVFAVVNMVLRLVTKGKIELW